MATTRILQRVGTFFYLVDPNTAVFQDPKQVPNYINEAVPIFIFLTVVEFLATLLQGKELRINSILSSSGMGIIHQASDIMYGFVMLMGYEWLYERRLMDIPWDSMYAWFAVFILVDFIYYWEHRAKHEVNFLWGAHQVHHSSEDFHYPVALRNSMLHKIVSFGFYHPLALLGFPLSIVKVHAGLNLLFQFWIHTEYIGKLGPIEWIFNTPSHHRVHHGANKWCLDKNYASVFILWDRMFGTFQAERPDEKIVYGLTNQPQKYNVIWHQFFHFVDMYHKAREMKTWGDVLKVIFYGPGWNPGTPRLGDPSTLKDNPVRTKYDNKLPLWQSAYILLHILMTAAVQFTISKQIQNLSWMSIIMAQVFIFTAVTNVTSMSDKWKWAPIVEATRCAFFVTYSQINPMTNIPIVDKTVTVFLSISALIWVSYSNIKVKSIKIL